LLSVACALGFVPQRHSYAFQFGKNHSKWRWHMVAVLFLSQMHNYDAEASTCNK